jgi:hypothetical protein
MNDKALYHFLMTHETGINFHPVKHEIKSWVHVPYSDLEDFLKIIQPQYEHYPMAELQEFSACVMLDLIFDDDGEEDIGEYQACFANDDFQSAFKLKREYEEGGK